MRWICTRGWETSEVVVGMGDTRGTRCPPPPGPPPLPPPAPSAPPSCLPRACRGARHAVSVPYRVDDGGEEVWEAGVVVHRVKPIGIVDLVEYSSKTLGKGPDPVLEPRGSDGVNPSPHATEKQATIEVAHLGVEVDVPRRGRVGGVRWGTG